MDTTTGRATLFDIASLDDPLLSFNYRVFFTDLPSGFMTSIASAINAPITYLFGAGKPFLGTGGIQPFQTERQIVLSLRCRSLSIPGSSIDQITIRHKGHDARYAGDRHQGGTVSLDFIEDQKIRVTSMLRAWMINVRDLSDNTSLVKNKYMGKMYVALFQQDGTFSAGFVYRNIWPMEVGDIALGATPEIVTVSAQFSYDECVMDKDVKDWLWNKIM